MKFLEFTHKYKLKKKATGNIKLHAVLKKIGLDSKVGIYLRDGNFSSSYVLLNLHPSKVTHWVCYIDDCCFDSYGCPALKKVLYYIKIKQKKCIYFEYQSQKNDSLCGSYV